MSEFGRKPFRGLPGRIERSELYIVGDTRLGALAADPYHLMVASHGHDPRHDLFLLGVACASTLLSYAVGITASFDHFTHIYASRNANARIFLKLGTDAVLDTTSSCSAPPARRASQPSSASPRYLLSTNVVLIMSHVFSHTTQTKFKAEDDDFLNKLHRQQGQSV
jgi:hypothetical protein